MNKRIFELADEAGFLTENGNVYADSFDAINGEFEAFAMLVIQECNKVADDSQYKCRTFPVSTSIKQHFGIE